MSRSSSSTVLDTASPLAGVSALAAPAAPPRHGRLISREHIRCHAASCPAPAPEVVHPAGVSGPRAAGTPAGGGRRRRVLTTIVDTVTAGRHRSTRVVTGGRGRPCGGPLRARCLRPGRAAGHHGGNAPGWVQRGHRTCASIRGGQRPGACCRGRAPVVDQHLGGSGNHGSLAMPGTPWHNQRSIRSMP